MINTLLGKIFGTKNEREVKRLLPRVAAINALEPEMQKLSDDELRAKTTVFRARIQERMGAIADAERRRAGFNLPELHRIKGVLLALRPPPEDRASEDALSAAVGLARRQGALAWELRATASLARQRLKRGRSAKVLRELAAVHDRFTEGRETPDLRGARDLLEQQRVDR